MANYIEAAQLPESEKVYLKKDFMGWRVVEPPTKWYHYITGSKRNFITLIVLLVILGFLMYAHFHDVNAIQDTYGKMADDPIGWCKDVKAGNISVPLRSFDINLTTIK